MNEIKLLNENGEILASSRDVARVFNKEHSKVKRTIKSLEKDVANFGDIFKLVAYEDSYGRKQEEYKMNRDGFSIVVMGFNGKDALQWKLKYIEAFNEMEEKLKSGIQLSEEERFKLMLFSKDPLEVVTAHNKLVELEVSAATTPLLETIEVQKPLVDFANHVTESSNSIDVGDLSKVVNNEDIDIGRNKLYSWLRDNKYLMDGKNKNVPYQKYIDNGYFEVVEYTFNTPYGKQLGMKTLVKGKGQVAIVERLRKEFDKEAK